MQSRHLWARLTQGSISTGTWYFLQIKLNTTTGNVVLNLDGNEVMNADDDRLKGNPVASIHMGNARKNGGQTYMSDVLVFDNHNDSSDLVDFVDGKVRLVSLPLVADAEDNQENQWVATRYNEYAPASFAPSRFVSKYQTYDYSLYYEDRTGLDDNKEFTIECSSITWGDVAIGKPRTIFAKWREQRGDGDADQIFKLYIIYEAVNAPILKLDYRTVTNGVSTLKTMSFPIPPDQVHFIWHHYAVTFGWIGEQRYVAMLVMAGGLGTKYCKKGNNPMSDNGSIGGINTRASAAYAKETFDDSFFNEFRVTQREKGAGARYVSSFFPQLPYARNTNDDPYFSDVFGFKRFNTSAIRG